MEIPFFKYQGTGNDFILIDQREEQYVANIDNDLIEHLCDRRFGIGADGLILLENDPDYDFRMIYFNADGRESTMCGNGGRCIVQFAHDLGIIANTCHFVAIDGPHEGIITQGKVRIKMQNVSQIEMEDGVAILNTGSPHYVKITDQETSKDIFNIGRTIRYASPFKEQSGINVNLVYKDNENYFIRTYERGVEDETLSCGTGVTAAALTLHAMLGVDSPISVHTLGGKLEVSFTSQVSGMYRDIWLSGPATFIYKGFVAI